MKLIIKKNQGELYSIFSSLIFSCNIEYFKNQLVEQWGMEINEELEKDIKQIKDHSLFDLDEAKVFFNIHSNTQNLFIDYEFLWNSETLEEYFAKIKNQSLYKMRQKLINGLDLDYEDEIIHKDDEVTLQLIIKLLKNHPMDNEFKWNLVCMLEDPISYIERFTIFINKYLPLFNEKRNKYIKMYEDFVLWMEDNLRIHGTEYLSNNLGIIDFSQFDELYLSYSLFDLSSTNMNVAESKCHVYLGLLFRDYVNQRLDKQDVERHLMVYKNFSDKTRFDIIRLLIEKESFGQEIAEQLGITTATVSYHIDYLLGASLVQVKKKSRKVFYSINKDIVRKSILFLQKELNL